MRALLTAEPRPDLAVKGAVGRQSAGRLARLRPGRARGDRFHHAAAFPFAVELMNLLTFSVAYDG